MINHPDADQEDRITIPDLTSIEAIISWLDSKVYAASEHQALIATKAYYDCAKNHPELAKYAYEDAIFAYHSVVVAFQKAQNSYTKYQKHEKLKNF
jgi:hypothetical protein